MFGCVHMPIYGEMQAMKNAEYIKLGKGNQYPQGNKELYSTG